MADLRLQGRQFHTHRAANGDGTLCGANQPFRCMTCGGHAFARLADHVSDIVADRADHGTAPAQGATVVDQRFPIRQILVSQWFGQTQCLAEFAPEGVFLFPHLAQRFHLVDRGVFRITRFGEKQAGLGAHAAMYAAAQEGGDRRVDLFFQGVVATFKGCAAHDRTPL